MSTPAAADEINSAEECQTQEGEQPSQSAGLNVAKTSLTTMPLSERNQTSAGVKRKAGSNDDESSHKYGRYLFTEILEPDILVDNENMMSLSSEGSDVQKYDQYLHDLIQSCFFSQVIKLLEDNHQFSQDTLDKALILACQSGHKHTVEKLIDHGASVCCRDPDGNTPLMISSQNSFEELVQFFLTRQADVNAANSAGDTALILSIQSTRSTAITTLLLQQKEIDIWHKNEHGYTAFMKAVEMFDISTFKILLKFHFQKHPDMKFLASILDWCNLDVQAKVKIINRAYSVFFQYSFSQITKSQISVVKRLLELGADVNGGPSVFPLCVATKAGSYPLVELLCQRGADCNKADRMFGHSPLSIAAEQRRGDLIELLLKFGANIHDGELHRSPVDQSFIRDHKDCLKFLVQHGAKVNFENALHNVIHNQNIYYMNLLLESCRLETRHYIVENRQNLLTSAVREANVEIVNHILDIGFHITGEHPCWEKLVVESGSGEIARFLIEKGADVNKMIETSCGSYTPLYLVLCRNDIWDLSRLQVVQALLENGASPNIPGHTSPLVLAALTGKADLLQLLLDYITDINCRNGVADTLQAANCSSAAMVTEVIKHGPNLNVTHDAGNTALLHGINRITDNGHGVNKITNNWMDVGTDTLMKAVRHSNAAVVMEVIKHVPDLNVTDKKGNTALLNAINRLPSDGLACGGQAYGIVTALVNAGCDVNWQNYDGISPLMLAANRYSKEVIQILLDAGADVNAVSKTDRTKTALSYLQITTYTTNEDVTACLSSFLSRGASLSYLQTKMFHRILLCNNIDIISKVIANGSGPLSISSDKYFNLFLPASCIFDVSPLCTALFSGHISLARHFLEIMFLTKYDVSALMYNRTVRFYLKRHHLSQCLNLLDKISSQPMSLLSLAFVTVSSAVGTSPGRENRVSKLPLPQILKDKLLFKSLADWRTRINIITSDSAWTRLMKCLQRRCPCSSHISVYDRLTDAEFGAGARIEYS